MPERVYTRFEDSDNEERPRPQQPGNEKVVSQNVAHTSVQQSLTPGKKRKRHHGDSVRRTDDHVDAVDAANSRNPDQPPTKTSSAKTEPGNLNGRKPPRMSFDKSPRLVTQRNRQALLEARRCLPIWSEQEQIRRALRDRDVLILSGETGSGKSTQVPQFLLQEQWCTGRVAVTQPRRVAAISLARRVAEELGSPLGSASPASRVGYSVRFDNSTSPSTRIKYLTEGMLLQEMLKDSALKEYSVVIVDEVHERSVNVDLILGFLKTLLTSGMPNRGGKPLKVVIMSATADTEKLLEYFDDASHPTMSSSTPDQGTITNRETKQTIVENGSRVSTCFVQGRQYPVDVVYLPESTNDILSETVKSIFQIHYKEPLPGDILVFLTGQEAIENLEAQIHELAKAKDPEVPDILVHPLFAALSQNVQQQIFAPAPPRTRKVILSTNIAETSVTVPGVRHVIDCGKAKMKNYYSKIGLEALLTKPISQSAATQRKGRAGREAPGKCYRLYTKEEFESLEKEARPEILRCDLSQSVLIMLARGVQNIMTFPFPDRPPDTSMKKSLLLLNELGALDESFRINEVGLKMSRLPLTPAMSRVIVEAARPEMDCLLEVIDILACLSVENVFIDPTAEEKREAANEARRDLFRREGDHFRLLVAIRAYVSERTDRKAWAEARWISHRAMQNVLNVRKQLYAQCKQLGFLTSTQALPADIESFEPLTDSRAEAISKCLIQGFFANVAYLAADGSYRTVNKQIVAVHPSSVLFGRKVEAIVFSEFLYTAKAYARNVSAIHMAWMAARVE